MILDETLSPQLNNQTIDLTRSVFPSQINISVFHPSSNLIKTYSDFSSFIFSQHPGLKYCGENNNLTQDIYFFWFMSEQSVSLVTS